MELIGFKQYITEFAPIIGALGRLAGGAVVRGGGRAVASGAASGAVRAAASNQGNQQAQGEQIDPTDATNMMVDRASAMQAQNVNGVRIRSAANNTPAVQSRTGPNAVGPDSVHNTNSSVMAGQALQMGQLYGANNVGTKYRR
jgi:hypothetical protein